MRSAIFCFAVSSLSFADQSITDSRTPPEVEVGSPAGSYALTNFETFNPYNGTLNIHIPLYRVGGRGEAGFEIAVVIQQSWQTVTHTDAYGNPYLFPEAKSAFGSGNTGAPYVITSSPGSVFSREATDPTQGLVPCTAGAGAGYSYYIGQLLTRLTFVDASGSSHELVDAQTNGQPLASYSQPNCAMDPVNTGTSRGSVFRAMDTSGIVFTSDQPIHDSVAVNTKVPVKNPVGMSGYLTFPSGVKYRVDYGYVTSIEDRNGNIVSITGGTITDSLGRTIQITQASGADTVTYPGAGGQPRTITLTRVALPNALPLNQLFPSLAQAGSALYSPAVLGSITLPDQSTYTFSYNSYGEVTGITLPTGGLVTYQFPGVPGSCASSPNSCIASYADDAGNPLAVIYRRLLSRTEYLDGVNASRQTTYNYSFGGTDPYGPTVTTVTDQDGHGTTFSIVTHHYFGDASSTDDLQSPPSQWYSMWNHGKESLTEIASGGQTWRRQLTVWQQRPCGTNEPCWFGDPNVLGSANVAVPHDPQVQYETIVEGGVVRQTSYNYDSNSNTTDQYDYDWGNGSLTTPVGSGGTLLRRTHTDFNTSLGTIVNRPAETRVYDGAGTLFADTRYGYDESSVAPAAGILGHDNAAYSGNATRGNLTSVARCLNAASCSWLTARYTYDIAGNVISTTDANVPSRTTTFGYSDGLNTYANLTSITNALNQTETWTYDYSTGRQTSHTDANLVQTTYAYNDPLDRLKQIRQAAGVSGVETQTNVNYVGTTEVDVYHDQNVTGDGALHTQSLYDGLGRLLESRQYEGAGSYISTTKTYDALGRLATAGNPCRPGAGPWNVCYSTSYQYDALGRVVSEMSPDSATVSTSYNGNQSTVTDQAGKARSTWTDGLGRVTKVAEDPSGSNYTTIYSYDPLDDLLCVNQGTFGTNGGCQPGLAHSRSFAYDSLKRLTTASNPESGAIHYSYDNVGNLLSKIDALGKTTSLSYDQLNRLTLKTYSDGTPQVTYTYDSAPGGVGHISSVAASGIAITNFTAYDALGRVKQSNQVVQIPQGNPSSQTYSFTYAYNLAGSLSSESYPSGRLVSTGYDSANRPSWLSGQLGNTSTPYIGNSSSSVDATDPTNRVIYWPHGEAWAYRRGNNVWHAASFNMRLQMTESYESLNNVDNAANMLLISCANWSSPSTNTNLYDECPHSSGANDNGNLVAYDEYAGGPNYAQKIHFSQTFTYDGVNRLASGADSGGWSRTFHYDPYGNMWVDPSYTGPPLNVYTPTANNYNANNQRSDQTYDAAGNLTAAQPSLVLSYDAENRLATAGTTSYAYDGNGQRVLKISGGATTVYVYDALGGLAAEYSNVPNTSPCATCYLSYDYLGSTRLVTDQNGAVVARHDYLPFGDEVPANIAGRDGTWGSGNDTVSEKFTGKERDQESGLDYFGARYYGSAIGRFTSPDPLLNSGRLENPQTWNRYTYGLNNPLGNTDPTGLYTCSGDKKQCSGVADALKAAKGALGNLKKGSAEYNALSSSINAYGKAGVDNGVHVGFGTTSGAASTNVGVLADASGNKITTADNPTGQNINVTVDPSKNGSTDQEAINLAHEGSHVADGTALVGALPMNLSGADAVLGGPLNMTSYQTEMKAYGVSSYTAQGLGLSGLSVGNGNVIWNSSWGAVDAQTLRTQGIQHELADPKGLYNVTPDNQGHKLIQ